MRKYLLGYCTVTFYRENSGKTIFQFLKMTYVHETFPFKRKESKT